MHIRRVSIPFSCPALLLLFAAGMQAQASASGAQASDSWSKPPASASSTAYHSRPYDSDAPAGRGHFTFKSDRSTPAVPVAPIPGARPSVIGAAMTADGRPPLNCRTSPHDPRCQ